MNVTFMSFGGDEGGTDGGYVVGVTNEPGIRRLGAQGGGLQAGLGETDTARGN